MRCIRCFHSGPGLSKYSWDVPLPHSLFLRNLEDRTTELLRNKIGAEALVRWLSRWKHCHQVWHDFDPQDPYSGRREPQIACPQIHRLWCARSSSPAQEDTKHTHTHTWVNKYKEKFLLYLSITGQIMWFMNSESLLRYLPLKQSRPVLI